MINLRKKISPRRLRLSQATHTLLLMPSLSSILSISTRLSIPNQSQNPTTLLSQPTTIRSQPTTILNQPTTLLSQFTTADTMIHSQHPTPSTMIPSMQTCTQPILHQHSTSLEHTENHTTNLTFLTFLITNHMCQSLSHTYLTTSHMCQNLNQFQNLTTQSQNLSQFQFQNHTTLMSLSQKKTFVYAIIQNMKIKSSNSSGKKHSYKIRSRPLWEQSLTSKEN